MTPFLPTQTIRDRMTVVTRFLDRKHILDLGVVGSCLGQGAEEDQAQYQSDLLFQAIVEKRPDVVGVDFNPVGVEILRKQGFNVRCEDVQTMDLGQRFDTIIAGEIIEHLENLGQFLRNVRRHLTDEGVLIVSTPNPFYAKQVWKIWRKHHPAVHPDHTCWLDPITLGQLMKRTGLEVVEAYWVQPESRILKTWRRFFRGYFSHSFLLVARRAPDENALSFITP